jgi:hypothetical protein
VGEAAKGAQAAAEARIRLTIKKKRGSLVMIRKSMKVKALRGLSPRRAVFTESIMGHTAHHRSIEVRDVRKFVGIIGFGENSFTEVQADFRGVYVNAQGKLHVPDVITANAGMPNSGNNGIFRRVLIELSSFYE